MPKQAEEPDNNEELLIAVSEALEKPNHNPPTPSP